MRIRRNALQRELADAAISAGAENTLVNSY